MKEELKPCPFCGGKDLEKEVIDGIEGMIYRVSCHLCANTMPMTVDTSMEEAIRIWNTRPVEDEMYRVLSGICFEKSARICDYAPESCKVCAINKALKKARGENEY